MKLRSKKFQAILITGILWFVILPAFLHFLTLDEMDVKLRTSFEKFDLENSLAGTGTLERVYGLVYILNEALREPRIFLEGISCIYSQVSHSHSKLFVLRC